MWRGRVVRACAAALGALALIAVFPALARPAGYVALGDSYASGVGTGTYYADSGRCRRSPIAYPVRVAARIGRTLEFVACSGATTSDVLREQVDAVDGFTRRVTISIGGNDAGFGRVVASCARPWPWTCWSDVDAAEAFARTALPSRLDRVYRAIERRSPRALVAVIGYPHVFNGRETCDLARISPAEQRELNEAGDLLARVIRSRALAHGFVYLDPVRSFLGHAVCDPTPWVTGLSFPLVESYHPNRAGHDRYASLVTAAID